MLYDKYSITLALFTKPFISGSNQSTALICTDFTCTVIFKTIITMKKSSVRFWLKHVLLGKYFAKNHIGLELKINIEPVILELKSSLKRFFKGCFHKFWYFAIYFVHLKVLKKLLLYK